MISVDKKERPTNSRGGWCVCMFIVCFEDRLGIMLFISHLCLKLLLSVAGSLML